jgi:hypothetical protein
MTAITQQDVLLAILALDSYNRGSVLELARHNEDALSTVIGPATVSKNSDTALADGNGAKAVGFSATSYMLAGGKTVIAYRGTDFSLGSIADSINFFRDVLTDGKPQIQELHILLADMGKSGDRS